MRKFTRSFFRACPDLSSVTHAIVRQKFLIHVGRDHLEPEEKQALKRLVEEELPKMQADAGTREGKPDFIKVKRSPAPCSDPKKKRFRFNSESESSSSPSSPDGSGPSTKNRTTKKTCLRRALKKAVESTDEDHQTDLDAKMGLEESSEGEAEGSVRSGRTKHQRGEEEPLFQQELQERPGPKLFIFIRFESRTHRSEGQGPKFLIFIRFRSRTHRSEGCLSLWRGPPSCG